MQKVLKIFYNTIPVILMIGLIPLVQNDYLLTIVYIAIISIFLKLISARKTDFIVLIFGFVIMIISEYFFISTGVETFTRNSLFGLMPLWLPFLWACGFVVIKRSVVVIG